MDQIEIGLEVGKTTLTVTELTARLKNVLEGRFGSVWVEGEVSNHDVPASGHHYFTLKDAGAAIRCVMFRRQALYSKFLPSDGRKILVHARVSVYEPRGEYQLVADRIEPLGIGALEIAFRELKERLEKEGLFDPARKKPVPEAPRKVGVVTSLTGAAIRDVIETVTSRSHLVDLLIAPVKVQGEGAASEIAEAIRSLDGDGNPWGRLDAIIVGRGGGSLEDLWAFNEEIVARAVAECRTPIISAVGHETDFSICDFVADLRAATPTAAAQRVSPRQAEIVRRLETLRARMAGALGALTANREERVLGLRRALTDPRRLIEYREMRLDDLLSRMKKGVVSELNARAETIGWLGTRVKRAPLVERISRRRDALENSRRRLKSAALFGYDSAAKSLDALGSRLESLTPAATLNRGYAIVRKDDGAVVRSPDQVFDGEMLKVTLAEGTLTVVVKKG